MPIALSVSHFSAPNCSPLISQRFQDFTQILTERKEYPPQVMYSTEQAN